jgi:hypothetical protein
LKVRRIRRLLQRPREVGQAMTEYILVIGLVVLPLAVGVNRFRNVIKTAARALGELLRGPGV